MKKSLFVAASALMLTSAIALDAQARDGFYVAARGGISNHNMNDSEDTVNAAAKVDFDDVWMASGALGYRWTYFRAEVEYTYRDDYEETVKEAGSSLSQKNELESSSLMLNGYLDFMPNYVVSPYLSGGIGYTDLTLTSRPEGNLPKSWEEKNFTWSAGAGMTLRINRCLNLDAGYRYLDMGELDNSNINAHEYYAGLRYTF